MLLLGLKQESGFDANTSTVEFRIQRSRHTKAGNSWTTNTQGQLLVALDSRNCLVAILVSLVFCLKKRKHSSLSYLELVTAAEKTGSDWNAFTAFLDRGLLYCLARENSCAGVKHPQKASYLTELCLLALGACQMQSRFKCCNLLLIHVLFLPLFAGAWGTAGLLELVGEGRERGKRKELGTRN